MLIYTVEIVINSNLEMKFLDFMETVHIQNVMKTGCFLSSSIKKQVDTEIKDKTTFLFEYTCDSIQILEYYQKKYSPALQKEVKDVFSDKYSASRKVFTIIK